MATDAYVASAGKSRALSQAVLQDALDKKEYWRLKDAHGKPPGVAGWWPSRAVTFLDNHDTGARGSCKILG